MNRGRGRKLTSKNDDQSRKRYHQDQNDSQKSATDYHTLYLSEIYSKNCESIIKHSIPMQFRVSYSDIVRCKPILESQILVGAKLWKLVRLKLWLKPQLSQLSLRICQLRTELPKPFNLKIELFNSTSNRLLCWRNLAISDQIEAFRPRSTYFGSVEWLKTCLADEDFGVRLDVQAAESRSSACSEQFRLTNADIHESYNQKFILAVNHLKTMQNKTKQSKTKQNKEVRCFELAMENETSRQCGLTAYFRIGKCGSDNEERFLQMKLKHICSQCDRPDKLHGTLEILKVSIWAEKDNISKQRDHYDLSAYQPSDPEHDVWINLCTWSQLKIFKYSICSIDGIFQNPIAGDSEEANSSDVGLTNIDSLVENIFKKLSISPKFDLQGEHYPKHFVQTKIGKLHGSGFKMFQCLKKLLNKLNENKIISSLFQHLELGKHLNWKQLSTLFKQPMLRRQSSTVSYDYLLLIPNNETVFCFFVNSIYATRATENSDLGDRESVLRTVFHDKPVRVIPLEIMMMGCEDFRDLEEIYINIVSHLGPLPGQLSFDNLSIYQQIRNTIILLMGIRKESTDQSPESIPVKICGKIFLFDTFMVQTNSQQLTRQLYPASKRNKKKQIKEKKSSSTIDEGSKQSRYQPIKQHEESEEYLLHEKALRHLYVNLCNKMDSNEVIVYLNSKECMTAVKKEEMQSEKRRYERNDLLLSWLETQPVDTFNWFCEALEASKQKHLSEPLRNYVEA